MRILGLITVLATLFVASISAAQERWKETLSFTNLANEAELATFVLIIERETDSGNAISNQSITDIDLEIVVFGGDAKAAITAPNQTGRDFWDMNFQLSYDLVSEGKIIHGGSGICSNWEGNSVLCGVEGDGGHFEITRTEREGFYDLTLILRPVTEIFEDDIDPTISVSWDDFAGEFISLGATDGKSASVTFAVPYPQMYSSQ